MMPFHFAITPFHFITPYFRHYFRHAIAARLPPFAADAAFAFHYCHFISPLIRHAIDISITLSLSLRFHDCHIIPHY
jgi:hypothetical protein